MTLDLDKLEQLARAATPGPWEAPHRPESVVNVWTTASEAAIRASDIAAHGEATGAAVFHELGNGIAQDIRGPDAAFIAAANPAAVLELVQFVRRAEMRVEFHQAPPVVAMDARSAEQLETIVRDLAAKEPLWGGHCVLCNAPRGWPATSVEPHAESCPYRRAVAANKP